MHPGYQNPDAIAPAGPVDPALTVLSVQSRSGPAHRRAGQLLDALLRGSARLGRLFRPVRHRPRRSGSARTRSSPPFVGIMSQGTSGDQMWMDYGQPKNEPGLDAYAEEIAAWRLSGLPEDRLSRLGSTGDGRDHAGTRSPSARRIAADMGQGASSPHGRHAMSPVACRKFMPRRPSSCMTNPGAS